MKRSSIMLLDELKEAMEFNRDPLKSAAMAKYMKSRFEYLGISQPLRKELSADFLRAVRLETMPEIFAMADHLWDLPEREYQYVAMELLLKAKKQWDKTCLEFFLELVTRKAWWDSVDFIASRLIGGYYEGQPLPAKMKTWVRSKDIWQNRTALLFQLNYKTQTDTDFLFDSILRLKDKKEFFIQKAIGWTLRQYHRTDPAAVEAFVESSGISGLAKREALKHA